MNKLAVEFVGTFFLVFTIGMTIVHTPLGVLPPLAIGLVLTGMIIAGARISGAYFNPAVSLAVAIRGRLPVTDLPGYMLFQVLGSILASAVVLILKKGPLQPMIAPIVPVMIVEFLFTFALVWVVLHVSNTEELKGSPAYGLAVGSTMTAGAFAVGSVSGAAFNPAVVLGCMIMGLLPASSLTAYLGATFGGAIVAALTFRLVLGWKN